MEGERFRITSPVSAEGRVELDPLSGVVRGWFDPRVQPLVAGPFVPRELAREVLRLSAGLLRWAPTLLDMADGPLLGVGGGLSVRFNQEFKGVPVMAAEVVVNLHGDSRLHSLYNQYHYDIPPNFDTDPKVPAVHARTVAARLSNAYRHKEIGPPRLAILRYEPSHHPLPTYVGRRNGARARFIRAVRGHLAGARRRGLAPVAGRHYLVWQVTVRTKHPLNAWLLLIDAVSGALIEIRDLVSYATGQGKVFVPNPIVCSGDVTLSKATPAAVLDALRSPVKLTRLDPADADGRLHLDGAWVHMFDKVEPHVAEPTSRSGRFVFSSANESFLDVMAYYHIDAVQAYLQKDLGLTGVAEKSIEVDPQGEGGTDVSQGSAAGIVFGGGQWDVRDASDAMVIVHEYGHALQDSVNPGSNLNGGEAEGFSDFLAAVYFDDKHKPVVPPTRGIMFSWNWNPVDFPGRARRYDLLAPLNQNEWTDKVGYELAQVWASAAFELYRKLGGDAASATVKREAKNLSIRLHLMGHAKIPATGATIRQIAQEIEAADTGLAPWRYANGLHVKVIQDTFLRRKVPGYAPKAVDVYVDDGRGGGYGAADGNDDNFQNALWLDNFTSTKDIWIKHAPYAAGAPTSPEDHETPLAGQEANAYVQVKNRGAAASGPITVRVFRAGAGGAREWSSGWTEIPAPPKQPADVPVGGAVTAGPFTFTPARADKKISLLAIVECPLDPAVTQTLAADPGVPFGDLVPFDNNIAMRIIAVGS